jgi:hypothetical protein
MPQMSSGEGPTGAAAGLLLGRYLDPLPIRSRGAFQLLSARLPEEARRRVIVLPGPASDPIRAAAALAEVERVHGLLDHPGIPPVTARGEVEGMPFLELDCDAVIDAIELQRLLGDAEQTMPYQAADGFIVTLRQILQGAHGRVDPASGCPVCLGRISLGNVLINAQGRCFLVGFGRNIPIEKDTGVADGTSTHFQAPELAIGAPATPMGDYVALLLLCRSLVPLIGLPGRVKALFGTERPIGDLPLIDAILWVERRVLQVHPAMRPTMEESIAAADRLRAMLGVTPDPAGFSAIVAALVQRSEEPVSVDGQLTPAPRTLSLGPDACWAAGPDGARCRLTGPLRRLLLALVRRHAERPGEVLTLWDLLEAGWPGERPLPGAGANRVYVTLARLRRLGLREVIERFDEGYRLSPQITVIQRS